MKHDCQLFGNKSMSGEATSVSLNRKLKLVTFEDLNGRAKVTFGPFRVISAMLGALALSS